MMMSLIVLCFVEKGIAIAADRRAIMECKTDVKPDEVKFRFKDHIDKIHVCANGCVVVHQGEGVINGEPVYTWIQRFVNNCITKEISVSEMPDLLLKYFHTFKEPIQDTFLIVGYDEQNTKHIYQIDVDTKEIFECDTTKPDYLYFGNTEFISRLLEKSELTYCDGTKEPATYYPPMIQEFTLQDAVNFCRFMVDTTVQMQHFVNFPLLTGGETDVIVLTKDETKWIQKEEVQ